MVPISLENSDVFPSESVAVAVMNGESRFAGRVKLTWKDSSPAMPSLRLMKPRKTCPSANPVALAEALAKNSIR